MAWMQYAGIDYELGSRNISETVTATDIAHSLASLNRYTGHAIGPYSVARHSVYVSDLLNFNPKAAMYGLVHDVHETVIGDISTPLAKSLSETARAELDALADAADEALYRVLGVPYPMPENYGWVVKQADLAAMMAEKRDIMPPCKRSWGIEASPAIPKVTVSHIFQNDVVAWLTRYATLKELMGA